MFCVTGKAHEAIGLGDFSISTKHILQFPATFNRSWKQKRGIFIPINSHASSTLVLAGTNTDWLLMKTLIIKSKIKIYVILSDC